jgi:archaemetzincin
VGPEITILNGSDLGDASLRSIADTVEKIFFHRVLLENTSFDLNLAFDSLRRQINSTALLGQILNGSKGALGKRIAIVDVDLFIPILTFVFGEAQLNGSAAVVSTHRLSEHYYGLTSNDALKVSRLEKEVVHELGHTFGLYHCRQFECVMRSSPSVEEIDLKRVQPCRACSNRLLGLSAADTTS